MFNRTLDLLRTTPLLNVGSNSRLTGPT